MNTIIICYNIKEEPLYIIIELQVVFISDELIESLYQLIIIETI